MAAPLTFLGASALSGRSPTKFLSMLTRRFVNDALHSKLQGLVVGIDEFGVVAAAGWMEGPGGGEEGFDGFVAQNEESSDRPEPAGQRLVAARREKDR
jgi:hypothetical protein